MNWHISQGEFAYFIRSKSVPRVYPELNVLFFCSNLKKTAYKIPERNWSFHFWDSPICTAIAVCYISFWIHFHSELLWITFMLFQAGKELARIKMMKRYKIQTNAYTHNSKWIAFFDFADIFGSSKKGTAHTEREIER